MKNKIFPHTFWRPFLDWMPQLFFRPKYVWFPVHLKGHMIPDPSGQFAELIVYITSTIVDLYSHQILLQQGDKSRRWTNKQKKKIFFSVHANTPRWYQILSHGLSFSFFHLLSLIHSLIHSLSLSPYSLGLIGWAQLILNFEIWFAFIKK